jgi:hypothetical protein
MRSRVIERIASNTYRKLFFSIDSYAKLMLTGVRQRFHYYFDWKSVNIGFGFAKTTGISGWRYMISFDLLFFSCWIYFVCVNTQEPNICSECGKKYKRKKVIIKGDVNTCNDCLCPDN